MINIQSIQPDKKECGSRMEQVTSSARVGGMLGWQHCAQQVFSAASRLDEKKFCGIVNKTLYIVRAMKLYTAVNTMRKDPIIYFYTLGKLSRSYLIFRRNNFCEH